jgi:hypothetical protein
MQKLLYFIFILLTIASCTKDQHEIDCVPAELQDHVIAFFPFTNGGLQDFVNRRQILINTNAEMAFDRHNNANCAYRFDKELNSTLRGDARFSDDLYKRPFSISLWFYATNSDIRPIGAYEMLVERRIESLDILSLWALHLGDLRLPIFHVDGIARRHHFLPDGQDRYRQEFFSDKWFHFVGTFDGENNRELYINGVRTCRDQDTTRWGPEIENVGDLIIGRLFTGLIDDIIFFDKELSQQEVNLLYGMTSCCE